MHIDVLDRHPFPYGLVRLGVAPDHPSVKNVSHKFHALFTQEAQRLRFLGQVRLGNAMDTNAICLNDLKSCYHAIVLAYGASKDKRLNLKNEFETKNVFSSQQFVGWYNGDLNQTLLNPDLSTHDTAIIIGNGNVAIDIARILLTRTDILAKTDITQNALDYLKQSKLKHIHIMGRRGPMQVQSCEFKTIYQMKLGFIYKSRIT